VLKREFILLNSLFSRFPAFEIGPLLLGLVFFLLPLSSTGKSIALVLFTIWIVLCADQKSAIWAAMTTPWCLSAFALFAAVCVACSWGPASLHQKIFEIEKYSKLLYLPLFVVGLSSRNSRFVALHAFLAAMMITASLSWVKWLGWSAYNGETQDYVFRNHIMTSEMMASAAYFTLLLYQGSKERWAKIAYLTAFVIFSLQILFINNGRSGYVMFSVLLVFWVIQRFYASWGKLVLAIGGVFLLLSLCYEQSSVLQAQYRITMQQIQHRQEPQANSIGFRLRFHAYAKQLWLRAPWLGNGAGAFTTLYHRENPIPERGNELLEPHSQYWLVATEMGTLGFILLFGFLLNMIWASWQIAEMRFYAAGIWLPFVLGNFSDSLLFFSGSGYFFLLMMALCLGATCKNISPS
jgi:O-antigen ligase